MHINHDTGTITIPASQYLRLANEHSERLQAEVQAETPRSEELAERIKQIGAEVREKNLCVDDVGIKLSSRAAELRKELDIIVPEFQALAEAHAKRCAMSKHMLRRATEDVRYGMIEVPANEAAVLLGIAHLA